MTKPSKTILFVQFKLLESYCLLSDQALFCDKNILKETNKILRKSLIFNP